MSDMTKQKKFAAMNGQRVLMMLVGILLIGMGVAFYRLSLFGVDSFTCMNLGISGYLGMLFGNWQLIVNVFLLIIVFFTVRHCIGLGTIINMVFVGYLADFLCWSVRALGILSPGILMRVGFLMLGTLLLSLGCALYMEANLGIAPYDSVAFIITRATREKVAFRTARVMSDLTVVLVGVAFCLAAQGELREIVGLGTVVNALCSGLLIQFFRGKIERLAQ